MLHRARLASLLMWRAHRPDSDTEFVVRERRGLSNEEIYRFGGCKARSPGGARPDLRAMKAEEARVRAAAARGGARHNNAAHRFGRTRWQLRLRWQRRCSAARGASATDARASQRGVCW